MPTYEIQAPDGRTLSVEGPTTPTEAELDEIFKSTGSAQSHEPATGGTGIAVPSAFAEHLLPYVQHAIEAFASSPTVPKTWATAGRIIGGGAPAVGGALEAGPMGAIAGLIAASKGALAGGKTGWFSGKLAQDIAQHVASMADKIEPYMTAMKPAVNAAIGAEGVGELAQMAEPDRSDIGMLGVGKSITNEQLIERLRAKLLDPQLKNHAAQRAGIVAAINSLKGNK